VITEDIISLKRFATLATFEIEISRSISQCRPNKPCDANSTLRQNVQLRLVGLCIE